MGYRGSLSLGVSDIVESCELLFNTFSTASEAHLDEDCWPVITAHLSAGLLQVAIMHPPVVTWTTHTDTGTAKGGWVRLTSRVLSLN